MNRKIGKLWGIRQQEVVPVVVGALIAVSESWILDLIGWGLHLGRDFCRKKHCWNMKNFKEGVGKVKEME